MAALLIFAAVLLVGLVLGRAVERSHFADLEKREQAFAERVASSAKTLNDPRPVARADLVVGSVVVSSDPLKRFFAGFRLFFGGELRSYAALIERARREALQRLKESSPHADVYLNVRFETCSIWQNAQGSIGAVEVFAYGTAVRFARTLGE